MKRKVFYVTVLLVALTLAGCQNEAQVSEPKTTEAPVVTEEPKATEVPAVTEEPESTMTPTPIPEMTREETPASAFQYSFSGGAIIMGLNENITEIVIPKEIEGRPVTGINSYAFMGCEDLTYIEMPESITYIGDSAFFDCSSLTSIKIPESVTYIGKSAFCGCSSLTSIEMPEGITHIEDLAFGYTPWLEEQKKGKDYLILANETLCWVSSELKGEFTIPEGVTCIGNSAFSGCENLTNIVIPETVTSICGYAFYMCNNLTSIEISENVTSIHEYAFLYCDNLTSIVTTKGSYAEQWAEFQGYEVILVSE